MVIQMHSWRWDGAIYANPSGKSSLRTYTNSIFNGQPCYTGYIDVYVDRDHETQDPPPPGAVPVIVKVEMLAMPERIFVRTGWTNSAGYIRFGSLEPARQYAVFSLGIQKQDGSGEWYVAEMYDRLYPTPD